MKKYEKVITACKWCIEHHLCIDCPYYETEEGCIGLKKDTIEVLESMKAELEQPTAMLNYEAENHGLNAELRKLSNKLSEAEIAHERTQRELAEAQNELVYLRAVKATAEAFLGVKING